jgi:trypsin
VCLLLVWLSWLVSFLKIFLPIPIIGHFSFLGALFHLPKPRLEDHRGSRIVGGQPINITQAPHQVSLQSSGSHICGGSIIAQNWVLTAAHCTDGNSASRLTVRVGSSLYASGGEVVKIKRIVQHEKFNYNTIDYDFSLLELEQNLTLSAAKKKIALPKQNQAVKDGTECVVSGWGNTQNSNESRNNLRAAKVPSVNQADCDDAYSSFGGVTDRMLCAGYTEGGKDACQGDSGGRFQVARVDYIPVLHII